MISAVEKTQAHANVPLRLRRALQSRVEAPLFRKPCMKMRGFFVSALCLSSANRRPSPTGAKTSVANVKTLEAKTHGIVPLVTF